MLPAQIIVELPNHPFCKMVAEKRREKEMSLHQLCRRVGTTSRSYMSEVEKGRFAPSFEVGSALCQVLDIPVYLYIEYFTDFHASRQRMYIEKSYTEWFEMIPEEVAIKMVNLAREESSQVHSEYYNKEYSMN